MIAILAGELRQGNLFDAATQTPVWRAVPAEVRVVDGETLMLGGRVIRLYGVTAPARGQVCGALGDRGRLAANELARTVRDRAVECRIEGWDRFGRALGSCKAGGVEINESLVAAGWALVDGQALPSLIPIEAEARAAALGLWAEPSC